MWWQYIVLMLGGVALGILATELFSVLWSRAFASKAALALIVLATIAEFIQAATGGAWMMSLTGVGMLLIFIPVQKKWNERQVFHGRS